MRGVNHSITETCNVYTENILKADMFFAENIKKLHVVYNNDALKNILNASLMLQQKIL